MAFKKYGFNLALFTYSNNVILISYLRCYDVIMSFIIKMPLHETRII